jgi:hypothetical protein
MNFTLTNILLPVLLALFVGLPLSIYAGFICGRILIFEEIKNRIVEIICLNSGPFESSSQIQTSIRDLDRMEIIDQRLEDLGHKSVSKELWDIILEFKHELSQLETDFSWSEARHKSEPRSNIIKNDITRKWFEKIDSIKPSIKAILIAKLKI